MAPPPTQTQARFHMIKVERISEAIDWDWVEVTGIESCTPEQVRTRGLETALSTDPWYHIEMIRPGTAPGEHVMTHLPRPSLRFSVDGNTLTPHSDRSARLLLFKWLDMPAERAWYRLGTGQQVRASTPIGTLAARKR